MQLTHNVPPDYWSLSLAAAALSSGKREPPTTDGGRIESIRERRAKAQR